MRATQAEQRVKVRGHGVIKFQGQFVIKVKSWPKAKKTVGM